jgi:CHAT domain-containing protein
VEDVDRMLLDRALASAARLPSTDAQAGDLMLAAAELLNRNLRYGEGEALSIVAAQRDEPSRRLAQTALRMAGQQAAWERRRLDELVQVMLDPDAGARLPQAGQLRLQMAAFVRARRDVAAALDARGGYGAAKGGLPRLAELQAALRPEEAFLVHVPTLEGLARICIRRDRLRSDIVAADRGAVAGDVRLLLAALTAPNPPSEALDRQYPVAAAQRMHALLLGGLEDCLVPGSRVVYAPAPELDGLPLAALLREAPPVLGDGYDLSRARWAALDYAIAYVDSARGFLAARRAAPGRGPDIAFLGIGDPALAMASGARTGGQRLARRSAPAAAGALADLPELPEAADELRAIAALFRGSARLLLGAQATEARFRLRRLSRYAILHFATHGLIRDDLPGLAEAALVLTPEASGEESDDGLLTASELAALRLRARLVVLSACNTARFDTSLFAGDVQGLSAALSVAGVPAVVASLWPVESATTRRLMTAFYAQLRGDGAGTISDALAAAVRQTIIEAPSPAFRHPRFWAPFILLGDGASTLRVDASPAAEGPLPSDDDTHEEATALAAVVAAGDGRAMAIAEDVVPRGAGQRSILELRSQPGALLWRQPGDADAVQALAAGPDAIFVAEQRAGEEGAAIVSAIATDGSPLWQRRLDAGAGGGSIVALSAAPDGGVVAVAAARAAGSAPGAAGALTVVRLDRDGVEKRRLALGPSDAVDASTVVRLALRPGEVLLAIGTAARPLKQFFQLDDFHLPRLCWKGGRTRLVALDLETLAMRRERAVEGIAVDGATPDGEGYLVAGTGWPGCAAGGRAFAARVSPDLQVDVLWRDDGPLPSRAVGIVPVAGGYAIAGTVDATLRLPEPDAAGTPRGPVAAAAFGGEGDPAGATAGEADAFLLRLAPDGSTEWQFADAGLATRLGGIAGVAGGAIAYGSIAGRRPFWMSLPTDAR